MIFIDGGTPVHETEDDFINFLKGEHFIHYVGMMNPQTPGLLIFFTMVQLRVFNDKNIRKDMFGVRIIPWGGIRWMLLSVPKEDREAVEKIASECGLVTANSDIVAVIDGEYFNFPYNNERLMALRNMDDHPFYGNDHAIINKILQEELQTVDEILHGSVPNEKTDIKTQ